jgi:hypothetical protein
MLPLRTAFCVHNAGCRDVPHGRRAHFSFRGAGKCREYHEYRNASSSFGSPADTLAFCSSIGICPSSLSHRMIKEYRLVSWPELPAEFQQTAHRRMLSQLSQRYMSLTQLVECSGMRRLHVQLFMDSLHSSGVVRERETQAGFLSHSTQPLRNWLRRALTPSQERR